MSMTDPVADMLTRIRNACSAGHRRVDIPASKLKHELAKLLRDNHYIADFKMLEEGQTGTIRLYLKYHNELPVIRELQAAGATSHNAIAKKLNARNVPTARGRKWTHVQVAAALARPIT